MLRVCAAGVEEFVPADEPGGGGTAVVQVFTDSETFRLMGKEHALVISNHRSDIDWLVGWVLAQRSGCLGSTLAVMKKSSKFLPICPQVWINSHQFFLLHVLSLTCICRSVVRGRKVSAAAG
ncbi:hypothetical protein LR48_Vigan02g030300 [Vigna angularis]|uniref:Phospholipid/glycerol acyltransferase domain-containing protein n=1 Tax=Phaseolus angularis TaxID=3914 RepID=A0A0L9TU80_PHAAN|nr:hypothetical protein LR48_Vigan02g030300 [Vigna angularis]